jgi:thioredoxin 1
MSSRGKVAVIVVLLIAIAGVVILKQPSRSVPASPAKPATLPRLLELGADKCIPCKMMQPVLAELRQEYAGKLQVDFIDVWKAPAAAEPYQIERIPTQILFAADGTEIYRHTGFFPKDEILAKFAELGIILGVK